MINLISSFLGLNISGLTAVLFGTFLIAALGYLLGSVKVKGLSLGTAGVFLVALAFGFLFAAKFMDKGFLKNFYIPDESAIMYKYFKEIDSIGLVLFVTAVGYIAGPTFFRNLKKNAKSYCLLGVVIIGSGVLVAVLFALIPGIGSPFSAGILSGALTSTPAFSAAEAAAGEESALVALGHAIAYPFGVVGVVLFVQLVPKVMKVDNAEEIIKMQSSKLDVRREYQGKLIDIDEFGLADFGIAVVLGIILGNVSINVGGVKLSLGNTGGPLIMALILGHLGHVGHINLKVPEQTLKVFREFGLMLFLIGAGVRGGISLMAKIYGGNFNVMLIPYGFIAGVIMTVLPMFAGFFFAKYVLKLPLFNNLGSITGGMTSTPALGTLVQVSGTDDVAGAYAATYPIALILIVVASNLMVSFI